MCGLRAGAASITATAGGGEPAMRRDLANLAAAVAGVGGTDIIFVAAVPEYWKLVATLPNAAAFNLVASHALPAGVVLAIAPRALAVALDEIPSIDTINCSMNSCRTRPSARKLSLSFVSRMGCTSTRRKRGGERRDLSGS